MTENSLAIFSRAAQMLAEADTIQKAKELKGLALTAAEWAKRKGLGEEAVLYARSYALEAERKMGEMLRETERAKGAAGIGPIAVTTGYHNDSVPTLAELGLTKKESARAQLLAEIPQETFEKVKNGKTTLTAARIERNREKANGQAPPLPSSKYRVIYADPPWKYHDQLVDDYGAAEHHYPTMTVAQLCAMPVRDLSAENSVLFMWVTSPMLAECWPVISSWGFTYKSSFVWDKVKHNMGHYNSVRHELLLICTRGSCVPDSRELVDSVQVIERTEHSAKPEAFRAIIDTLYPAGKRIELFARRQHDGWDTWGNQ